LDSFKEDITELRNFKLKHGLDEMVVHFYESNMDNNPYWIYVSDALETLVRGTKLSYMLFGSDYETGMYPLITTNSLYLIEMKNDGNDCLDKIEYYKKRVLQIKNKLSFTSFTEKAPKEIVELEKQKLKDFEKRWELASIGYTFV